MKKNGYFGIGMEHSKTKFNYGSLYRTAHIFNADFIYLIGKRFKHQPSDTTKSWKHIPLLEYKDFEDFNNHRPYDCMLIGIELDEKAIPLERFSHPKKALYLLGAEDHGLTKNAMEGCQLLIKLPGEYSLNVSVAGSIVLYDRIAKAEGKGEI